MSLSSNEMEAEPVESTYRAKSGIWAGLHLGMAMMSTGLIIVFVTFTITNAELADQLYTQVKSWIENYLGWFFMLIMSSSFLAAIWLLFSPLGVITLGDSSKEPEFSRFAWFSMLFSAAIGIGLLFWSVAEPILHFQGNPFLEPYGIAPETNQAAQVGMRITLLHWGLHGWAVFALVGLCLAYFSYNKGLPLTMRSALYPLIGNRMYGPWGHAVDLLAVFGTVFGVATTLGLAVSQMNAGLNYLFGIEISTFNQVMIIGVVTLIATVSTVSGVERGMRIISTLNIRLSILMLLFFLFAGPTAYLMGLYVTSVGDYLIHVVPLGFWVDPDINSDWQGDWTIFYWGWWLSWAPFVGMFIARISRGRTIREFLIGVMIVPTILAFFWLCVFGGSALYMEIFGDGGVKEAVNQDLTMALYRTIELVGVDWATWAIAALATFLMVTWFVTSADSGTLVICTILSMGDKNPPRKFRVFWGAGLGLVAAALLLAGGLTALKNMSIIISLPFAMVLLIMMVSLGLELSRERTLGR